MRQEAQSLCYGGRLTPEDVGRTTHAPLGSGWQVKSLAVTGKRADG